MASSTHRPSTLKKQTTDAFVQKLKRACHWLDIGHGRTRDYVRLLEEFDSAPRRSDQHVLAYFESCEIVELLELWEHRIHQFAGLKAKLQIACGKGPILTDDENTSNSGNKPRNDLFVYLMAGKFLAAGISVESIDGICAHPGVKESTADLSCRWNALDMNVECKRVNSPTQLPRRAKDARNQIDRSGRFGIIAIDCSVLARPARTLLETGSPVQAQNQMFQWLENNVVPQLQWSLSPQILGFVFFARIPAMTATGILDANEQEYRRRDCISSILAVGNHSCPDQAILRDIAQRLKRAIAPDSKSR